MLIESSNIWKEILKHKHKFYSNNMKAFIGYARKQTMIYSQKGERILAAKEVISIMDQGNQWEKLSTIWDKLPKEQKYVQYKLGETAPGVTIKEIVICGKILQETALIGYSKKILINFVSKYGKRARQAEQNKGIDWKAVSHAIRIATELKELYQTREIIFPLVNASFIKDIKMGKLHYINDVLPYLDTIMDEIEYLALENKLNFPQEPDRKFWDEFLIEIIKKEYFPTHYILDLAPGFKWESFKEGDSLK